MRWAAGRRVPPKLDLHLTGAPDTDDGTYEGRGAEPDVVRTRLRRRSREGLQVGRDSDE